MQQCLNILVPGNYEAAEFTIFMHRSMLTQICQYGVGIVTEILVNRGELYTLRELTYIYWISHKSGRCHGVSQ